ncbi:MAG: DsbC family protein [Thermodesulfobacteriota bacterium]
MKRIAPEIFLLITLILMLSCSPMVFPTPGLAECPQKEKIQQGLQRAFPKLQFELVKISPSEARDLCQVEIKTGGRHHLIYTDRRGDFVLTGNLHEVKTGKNLTQENLLSLNRLTPEDLRQLESLTAFSLGKGKKMVFLITDPQCPFCKQAETLLKKLVEKEDIQVRFILFPLESYKGSKEQCISVICDNKGIEGFDSGYRSDNQCPEGIKKIENAAAFMLKKGINSTPTLVFADGLYLSGLPSEEALRSRLGVGKGSSK